MKRLLALLLAALMIFGLTACSESDIELAADILTEVVLDSLEDGITSTTSAPTAPKQTTSALSKNTTSALSNQTTAQTTATSTAATTVTTSKAAETSCAAATSVSPVIDYDGLYYEVEDVALYIHTYGELPANFITKDEARDLGWKGGSVEEYAPGCVIGGDVFQNREGLLPKAKGRTYYECDIDTIGRDSRGEKRIVFSDDGLIYYTKNHYESFTLLYGEE